MILTRSSVRLYFGLGRVEISLTRPIYESRAFRELNAWLMGLSDRLAISI